MWLNNFQLGRPNHGTLFQLNPTALDYTPRKIGDFGRGLDGSGVQITLSRNRPLLRINGNYITPEQFNQFTALMQVDDVSLLFEPVDYSGVNVWESWMERVIPISTTAIPIPENSFTMAARLRQYYGGTGVVRLVGLYAAMKKNLELSLPDDWKQRVGSVNLIAPGIWGTIFKENFNLLATGLLVDAGPWLVTGGNGTTRDIFVSDEPAEVLEGAKGVKFITDGAVTALRASWENGGHTVTSGFIAEYHIAEWKAQMVSTVTDTIATIEAIGPADVRSWRVDIEVTSATTADLVISLPSGEVYRAAFTDPFDSHDFKVETKTAGSGGPKFTLWVDTVQLHTEATYPGDVGRWEWTASRPAGGAVTIFRLDDFNVYDGDGYDPVTGQINIVVSSPLTDLTALFATYQYNAVAVNLAQVPYRSEGGWVNFYRYGFQLEGM